MEKVIKVQTDALFSLSRDYKNYGESINGIYRTEAGKIERELENILRNYSDYSSVKSKVFELQRMLGENRQKIKDVQGRAESISGGLHHAAQSYIEAEEKEKKLIKSQKDKVIQLDDVNKVNKPGISINVDLKRPDEKDPDSISDTISKAVDKGIDFIRNIDVKETISGITKKVGNTVSNIKDNISDAVSKCGNKLEDFFGRCKSAVSNIADKVKDMWNKFTSECSKIFKKAREFFADFGKKVTEVAKFIADKAIVAVNYVIEHKDAILDGLKTVGIVLLEVVQFILDIAGLIPGIGEIADAINGCIYLLRGDMVSAGLSFAACIPFAGWGATIGKFIKKGAKLFEKIGDVSKLVDKVKDFAKYFDKLKDFGKTITKYGDNVLSFIKKKGSEVWNFLSKSKLVQKAKEVVSKVAKKIGDVGSFLQRQVDKVKVNIGDWLNKQAEKGRIPPKVAEWINKHVIGDEARERLAREAAERAAADALNLWKKSSCSTDELYNYLKKIDPDAAETFIKEGKWPANVQVPKGPSVLKPDGTIDWSKAPNGGYVLDSAGNAIKDGYIPKVGEMIDRYGPPNGRYTSPMVGGKPYNYDERALPYIEDATQYHRYEVTGDISKLKEYVENCKDPDLKDEIEGVIDYYYNGDYSKVITYKGDIAGIPGWGSGGGVQYEFPIKVEYLEKLGILKEIK